MALHRSIVPAGAMVSWSQQVVHGLSLTLFSWIQVTSIAKWCEVWSRQRTFWLPKLLQCSAFESAFKDVGSRLECILSYGPAMEVLVCSYKAEVVRKKGPFMLIPLVRFRGGAVSAVSSKAFKATRNNWCFFCNRCTASMMHLSDVCTRSAALRTFWQLTRYRDLREDLMLQPRLSYSCSWKSDVFVVTLRFSQSWSE